MTTSQTPAIDTLTCTHYGCTTIVADDLGSGWVRVRGTAYVTPDTREIVCEVHNLDSGFAIEDEVNLLAVAR